jgi:hypothetical protein
MLALISSLCLWRHGWQAVVQRVASLVMLQRGPFSSFSFDETAALMRTELAAVVAAHTSLTAHHPPAPGTPLVRSLALCCV